MRSKTKTNRDWSWFARTRFPALGAGYMHLLRGLIDLLCCLRVLWLAKVVAMVLILRHSIENRSNLMIHHLLDSEDNLHSGCQNIIYDRLLKSTLTRTITLYKLNSVCVRFQAVPHRVVSCSANGFTRIWDLDFPDVKVSNITWRRQLVG